MGPRLSCCARRNCVIRFENKKHFMSSKYECVTIARLHSDSALLDALFTRSPIGVCVIDHMHRVLRTNPAMDRLNGVACGPDGLDPAFDLTDRFVSMHEPVETVFTSGAPLFCEETPGRLPSGEPVVFVCDYLPVPAPIGVEAVLCLIRVCPYRRHPKA